MKPWLCNNSIIEPNVDAAPILGQHVLFYDPLRSSLPFSFMNDFASNQASVLFAQASSSLHSIVNAASGPGLALLLCEKQILSFSI